MPKGIVGTYEHEMDFWNLHPVYLTIPDIKKLHSRDRTKDKNKSSLIMWALVLVYDTGDDNPFRNIPVEERKKEIATNVLGDPKFDWDKYQYVIDKLIPMVTTQPQRSRDNMYDKMHERDMFLARTAYTMDGMTTEGKIQKGTADQLDKMLANTSKIYEQLERIDKQILLEDSKESNKIKSESEDGLI